MEQSNLFKLVWYNTLNSVNKPMCDICLDQALSSCNANYNKKGEWLII